jgi:hypothetical protein
MLSFIMLSATMLSVIAPYLYNKAQRVEYNQDILPKIIAISVAWNDLDWFQIFALAKFSLLSLSNSATKF